MVAAIVDEEEYFLERWALRMEEAGYLQHTTAKRADCLMALNDFLAPIRIHREKGYAEPDFPWLIRHEEEWGQPQIESARRHRMRGITADMYLGCFKTFIHSLVDVLEKIRGLVREQGPGTTPRQALRRRPGGPVRAATGRASLPDLAAQKLDEANRHADTWKSAATRTSWTPRPSSSWWSAATVGSSPAPTEAVLAVHGRRGRHRRSPVWEALLSVEGQSLGGPAQVLSRWACPAS